MARPVKDVVDYFPHDCEHHRTMFIIEERYGNNGYAFWFKLLELLGRTPGHFIDCSNDSVWEFLQAKTRQDNGFCANILELLAKLDAIDKELWNRHRVIWSQNLVDRIAEVYKNRKREIPKKPNYDSKLPLDMVSTTKNKAEVEFSAQPTTDNPAEVAKLQGKSDKGK